MLLARRWFPGADPYDPETQAGAVILERRETERQTVAVQNGIARALRIK